MDIQPQFIKLIGLDRYQNLNSVIEIIKCDANTRHPDLINHTAGKYILCRINNGAYHHRGYLCKFHSQEERDAWLARHVVGV